MFRDGRAAVRQQERSRVVISGVDVNGVAFEEMTESRDISEEGLSFYLCRPIWINSHLTAEVSSKSNFGPSRITRIMVVRIQTDPSGKRLVAARFDE